MWPLASTLPATSSGPVSELSGPDSPVPRSSPLALASSDTGLPSPPMPPETVSFGCSSGAGQNEIVADKVVWILWGFFRSWISLKLG